MPKSIIHFLFIFTLNGLFLGISPAQSSDDSIKSGHLRIQIPRERSWIGRDTIHELENGYLYFKRIGASPPRMVNIIASWNQAFNNCNRLEGNIIIGMERPSAVPDPKGFFLHNALRELAHLGLIELTQGGEREDNKFLFEGMAEILSHEYEGTTLILESAWIIARLLDEMQMLGMTTQRSWSTFSGGRSTLRSCAPGITFLTTFRELHSRERAVKFFEFLKNASLNESLVRAFKVPVADQESAWLKRVREYQDPGDVTIVAESAPQLIQTKLVPETGRSGTTIQIQLQFKDSGDDLLADGVFVKDERTGRVMKVEGAGVGHYTLVMPIDENCSPGEYNYNVTAIDEAGNTRHWKRSYKVMVR
jgi:hypothetical protein